MKHFLSNLPILLFFVFLALPGLFIFSKNLEFFQSNNHDIVVRGLQEHEGVAIVFEKRKTSNYKSGSYQIIFHAKDGTPILDYEGALYTYYFLDLEKVWEILKRVKKGATIPIKWVFLENGERVFTEINGNRSIGVKENFSVGGMIIAGGYLFFLLIIVIKVIFFPVTLASQDETKSST